MSKKHDSLFQGDRFPSRSPKVPVSINQTDGKRWWGRWHVTLTGSIASVAFELLTVVEAMPIFREWVAGTEAAKIASRF